MAAGSAAGGGAMAAQVESTTMTGWSRADAISIPLRSHYITANGRTQRMAAWAREMGISETSILGRLARGWTEEEAVTRPLRQKPRYITVRGRTLTLSEWARKSGLKVSTIHRRLKDGWSPADAVKRPLQLQKKRSRTP